MMFSSSRNPNEDDSVSLSIGSDTLNEKLETSLNPGIDSDIRQADVLCGRGKTSFNHTGNKWFRDAVSNSMEDYMKAENRFEKSLVVHSIMDRVKKEGGRFLKKDHAAGKWVELSEPQAKEKVGHAVRDAVNALEGRKKKGKRSSDSIRGPEIEGPPTISPRTQQVRSVQSVLASISSAAAAAERQDMPPRPPTYAFNEMSASNLLPQLQSISLRPPHSVSMEYYGYETEYSKAPMTAQVGHASWSGNTSTNSPAFMPATRHHSLPLGSSEHGSSNDYYQSEQILRRRALDPLGIEQHIEPQQPMAAVSQSAPVPSNYPITNLPPAPPAPPVASRPADAMDTDQDDNFLEKIYSVLGPMQSDLRDPMEPYLHDDNRRTDRKVG